jgi:DNA-binding CsgD family transcriptional regulator
MRAGVLQTDRGWKVDSAPIGREAEVGEICAFLSVGSGEPAALVITGDVGIGKTVVWKHVAQAALRPSFRVLSCRPASSERPLAFSALDDLLADVIEEFLPELSESRRQAVTVALARGTVLGSIPDRHVLARGVLDAFRILSSARPLLVAVDDAQWLDRPSASVLEFCFRRLEREPVSILLTFRGADLVAPLGLDQALSPGHLSQVKLGPLSLGAIGEILRSQLGVALPRYTLTRLYEACGGNPFYALESARALVEHRRTPPASEPIPVPKNLGDLVRHHLRGLSPEARDVGRLVAASSDPRERLIRAAYGAPDSWVAIDQAIDDGIIERDGDSLRFTHPLLRSVLYAEMTLNQRRHVHQRLGAIVEEIEERAWHLALGAEGPSEEIAEILGGAAEHAASRGAPASAAVLEEQATRLTPASRPEKARERSVHAADYHFRGGEIARSRELIESAVAACPAGPARARLLVRLGTIHYHEGDWSLAEKVFRQAAKEAPENPALCAHAEQELAFARLVAGDLPDASRWAHKSLRSAERAADQGQVAHSLARIALVEFLLGNGVRSDLFEKAEALDAAKDEQPIERRAMLDPSLLRGLVLKWCDRLDEARVRLADRYQRALDRGDEASLPFLLYHFSQLECWAGNWDRAEEYALEGCRVADESHQVAMRPTTLYSLALVRAHRGQVQDARELAGEALILCERTGNAPFRSMVLSVLGFVALSLDDYQAAHSYLGRVADAGTAAGFGEPNVVKFLPDEIEALVALGEVDDARSLTSRLEALGKSLGRSWALATAARCRAHLAAIDGDFDGARSACDQALSEHARLPMPFELGRTLLVKGMIERRAKQKAAARQTLGQALGIFEHLGAPLWAGKARQELSKIAARGPVDGLTETERRVAALVAQGRTNREIASAMFVTENTVQTHVRHVFRKLGVRSRTELAVQLLSEPTSTASASRPSEGSEPSGTGSTGR